MKKCLIVVDYQVDFVSGALGFAGAELLASRIANKIRAYRTCGDDVVFTFDTHGDDYAQTQEGRKLPVAHCLAGTPGHQLYGEVARLLQEGDRCFCKPAFPSAELYDYLRQQPYAAIELVGLVSDICVIANAVLAKTAQPETEIIVDAACTASFDPAKHAAALAVLDSLQIELLNA